MADPGLTIRPAFLSLSRCAQSIAESVAPSGREPLVLTMVHGKGRQGFITAPEGIGSW